MKWHFIGAAPIDDLVSRRGGGDSAFRNGDGVGDGADSHQGNGFGSGGNSVTGGGWGRFTETMYVELSVGIEEES